MDDLELPAGRYLSCAIDVHADNAGQTKALLMRNRIFAARTGVVPTVLSFGASNDMAERRSVLAERGLVDHGVELLNIFEHYQDTDWPEDVAAGRDERPLADLRSRLTKETALADGTPWRRTYRLADGTSVYDYLRPDGTAFLRMPAFVFREAETWPTSLLRVSRAGAVVGEHDSLRSWYHQWLRELTAGHERSFVFCDSRFLAPLLAPFDDPSVHLIYLLHNIHLAAPQRWDSPTSDVHERLLGLVGEFDAFVTLTERQREDVAQRCGARSNLFVVPNPVDLPTEPQRVERDPHQVTVMARLVSQKRLRQAVEAMRLVVADVPQARLDIFGDGPRADSLQQAVDRLGLSGSVTLRGHDPRARDTLWRSSAFVMTSGYEGYPLSTLESMSHACPVVSYDIKYGPREQITDGVDGFLVPSGDVETLAARLRTLLTDPGLVERMGSAAREKAAHHGYDRFLSDWVSVVQAAVRLKSARTTIEEARLDVTELGVGLAPLPRRSRGGAVPGVHGLRRRLSFSGRLTVRGRGGSGGHGALAQAKVTLSAVHEPTSSVVEVPLEVRPDDTGFDLRASVALGELYPDGIDPAGRSYLRLRVVWQNSAWETRLRRPDPATSGVEVSFERDGELALERH
ncbi:MAG: glycosyltransferase [Nocardioidaceae bacterium]